MRFGERMQARREELGLTRQELAALLGLQERQCGRVLDAMAAEGTLQKTGYAYCLPAQADGKREDAL